jgi:hypothetical protein
MLLLLLTTFAAAEQTAAYYDIVGGPAGNAGTLRYLQIYASVFRSRKLMM